MPLGPLVGRTAELRQLRRAVEVATAGRRQVVVVAGEPGIGKTALVEEVSAIASEAGALVAVGRAWESGGAPPYWPWVQVLRTLVDEGGVDLGPGRGAGSAALRQLLPELGPSDVPALEGDQGRFALFDAVTSTIRAASRSRPLCIVLDDLHAAGVPSALLLQFVARSLGPDRVLLLATHRLAESRRDPQLDDVLAEIAREGFRLELSGLSRDEVRTLAQSVLGSPPDESDVDQILTWTAGNPLFVQESLRAATATGTTGATGTVAGVASALVPATVRVLVRQRLRALPDATQSALVAAAVLGRASPVTVIATVTASSVATTLAVLEPAIEHRLVALTHGSTVTFVHELLREAVIEDAPPTTVRQLHLRCATRLAERAERDPVDTAAVAHHLVLAGPDAPADLTVRFLLRAGQGAIRRFAAEEAVALLTSAQELLDEAGLPASERCEVLLALAEARAQASDFHGSAETFAQALVAAREGGTVEQEARAVLGSEFGWTDMLVDESPVVAAVEALLPRVAEDDLALRAHLLARMAGALRTVSVSRAMAASDLSVALARQSGDERVLAAVLRIRGTLLWAPQVNHELASLAAEVLDLGGRRSDPYLLLQGYTWRAIARVGHGDVSGARADFAARDRIADRLGTWFDVMLRRHTATLLALIDGRFDDAERTMEQAYEYGWVQRKRMGALLGYAGQKWVVLDLTGRFEEAVEFGLLMLALAPDFAAVPVLAAFPLAKAGRLAEARDLYDAAAGRGFEVPPDGVWLIVECGWAEVAHMLDDRAGAAVLHAALLPYEERVVVGGHGASAVSTTGPAARFIGLLEMTLGRLDDAVRHLEAGLAVASRMGSPTFVAQCSLDLARALLARGDPDDRGAAASAAQQAAATAERLGMRPVRDQAAALLASLGGDTGRPGTVAPRPTAGAATACLRCEGDVWRFSFRGTEVAVRDSTGVRHLATLLARPGVEVHALDLAGVPGESRPASAGTGPVLDDRAKAAYRRRVEDLREDIDEAEAFNDYERASKAQAEMDELLQELAAAVGLGGRDRPTRSDAERARVAVTKALKATLRRLHEHDPQLARYLSATVRTGTFCCFEPDRAEPLAWTVAG